jgi:beta-N-acetylhexosaminidase
MTDAVEEEERREMDDDATFAGRVLMVGLPGRKLDRETASRLEALRPGGIILFGRNLESAEQTARLIAGVRRLLPYALLVAIDQEGGRVSRLKPWIGETPTAVRLAASGVAATQRFAAASASALRTLGFNLDFAPVVDLCAPDASNGIGDRSFAPDPEVASSLAAAFLEGLQSNGVAGCLKHFPGLGATSVDSHRSLPTAARTREELETLDLVPYRRLAPSAATVMIGHGHYPVLDATPGLPASLSFPIVTGLLRERIGFRGLVVSDDLEMGAVAPLDENGRAAIGALRAGCHVVLYCSDLARAERAARSVADEAARDPAFGGRLRTAAAAVHRTAANWPAPQADPGSWPRARDNLARASYLA